MSPTSNRIHALAELIEVFVPKKSVKADILQFIVSMKFGDTHLPFLFDVLGREKFLEVLDIFQDTEMLPCPHCQWAVKWPARDALSEIVRDVYIYYRLSKASKGDRAGIIRDMEREFSITASRIRYSYAKTKKFALQFLETLKHHE